MKKKIITCASVSFVIILVLLSVNFLQSGTGNISKENIEKENEFKKSLDVVAQMKYLKNLQTNSELMQKMLFLQESK